MWQIQNPNVLFSISDPVLIPGAHLSAQSLQRKDGDYQNDTDKNSTGTAITKNIGTMLI